MGEESADRDEVERLKAWSRDSNLLQHNHDQGDGRGFQEKKSNIKPLYISDDGDGHATEDTSWVNTAETLFPDVLFSFFSQTFI